MGGRDSSSAKGEGVVRQGVRKMNITNEEKQTTLKVLKEIRAWRMATIDYAEEHGHELVADAVRTDFYTLTFAIDIVEASCKTENKSTEEPKTDKGMFMPEGEGDAETDDFVGRSLTEITVKVNQMEKEFDEVIKNLKRRLDNGEKRMWFIENKVQEVDKRVWK